MVDYINFDKSTFAILLENAKGDRSINQYANIADVSAAHISRLLRKLINTPPSPDTINKLSSVAANGVTYSDFMIAAGHIDDMTQENFTENKIVQTKESLKKFFQVIISDIYTRDFEWSLKKDTSSPIDLLLEIKNWEYSKWYIQIKPFVTSKTLYNVYGQIACFELSSDIKVSIAVGSKNEFDLLINNSPKALAANLYVMLVDLCSGKIVQEEKLCQY